MCACVSSFGTLQNEIGFFLEYCFWLGFFFFLTKGGRVDRKLFDLYFTVQRFSRQTSRDFICQIKNYPYITMFKLHIRSPAFERRGGGEAKGIRFVGAAIALIGDIIDGSLQRGCSLLLCSGTYMHGRGKGWGVFGVEWW